MATLTFNEFIGGSNVVPLRNAYPSERSKILITIGDGLTDITGYTFEADYQTLIVDPVTYDRAGNANFAESVTIGSFPKVEMTGADVPVIDNAAIGTVVLILPENMYTGPMIPRARTKVPITVVGFTFYDVDDNITTIRFPIMMNYEPDVEVGDPTLDINYTALTLGA